jgi:hypothetical protein
MMVETIHLRQRTDREAQVMTEDACLLFAVVSNEGLALNAAETLSLLEELAKLGYLSAGGDPELEPRSETGVAE